MGGLYPNAERIARTLLLSAMAADELSLWVKYDERILRGEIQVRSRWIALETLAALHPKASFDILAAYVGGLAGVAAGRPWLLLPNWDRGLIERMMVQVVAAEIADPPASILPNPYPGLKRALTGVIEQRLAIIHRKEPRYAGL